MSASSGAAAARVGSGILITRLLGLVRERVFAHYFGNGPAADAFRAALKIPNVIRNLLGEGTLSASFIPVYAGLLERGEREQARRLAGIVISLLTLVGAAAAFLGVWAAPVITDFAAPGFEGTTRALTIRLVEILFPMAGVFILAAWCLGVLNSHRRFFLSYAAPSAWNIAQIATLVALGGTLAGSRLVIALAWGALAGAVIQLAVQVPATLKVLGGLELGLDLKARGVARTVRAWIPVVVGAGVAQISSIIDIQLASLLSAGAVAALGYAHLPAILPVSLFGTSVAASTLPEMSRDAAAGTDTRLRERLGESAQRIMFYALPAAFAYATLGSAVIGLLFQTGRFDASDTALVAGVLAAYAVALPAQANIRLLASGHYAMGDTKTPVLIATGSMVVSAGSAFGLMQFLGVAGIALGSAVGAYLNVTLNLHTLARKLGSVLERRQVRSTVVVFVACLLASATGALTARLSAAWPLALTSLAALGVFGITYLAITLAARHPDAREMLTIFRKSEPSDRHDR